MAAHRQSIALTIIVGLLIAAVAPAAAFISNCNNAQDVGPGAISTAGSGALRVSVLVLLFLLV